jgi:hypothetical protein
MRRAAIITLTMMLAALAALAEPGWEKKDWTTWLKGDCQDVFYYSAWGLKGPETDMPELAGNAEVVYQTYIQLYSALPFRQALARDFQLKNNYEKADAQEKLKLDQEANADFFTGYDDKIVVRYLTTAGESGVPSWHVAPPGSPTGSYRDGALTLSDGTQVLSTKTISAPTVGPSTEFSLIFPRVVNGQPVIKPNETKITVQTGWHVGGHFTADGSDKISFDLTKMMYKGKLEY